MANWCSNSVQFIGDEKKLENLGVLFEGMMAKEGETQQGQLPHFASKEENYLFFIGWQNGQLDFETKWTPNIEVLVEIANCFDCGFKCYYSELGNGIYGEAQYQDGELIDVALDWDDLLQYQYSEETDDYVFEGEHYECDTDILEILLERKRQIIGLQMN